MQRAVLWLCPTNVGVIARVCDSTLHLGRVATLLPMAAPSTWFRLLVRIDALEQLLAML
jgi:hypothetical protein